MREAIVERLAGVLFEVQPCDSDALGFSVVLDLHRAAGGKGEFVLRNLVALGQIGVEVVFPGKTRMLVNGTIQRQGGAHAHLDRAFVQNWQRSGQAETDRANIGVWRVAEARRAAAEDFTLGQQFGRDGGFGEEFGHWLKRKYSREARWPDYQRPSLEVTGPLERKAGTVRSTSAKPPNRSKA